MTLGLHLGVVIKTRRVDLVLFSADSDIHLKMLKLADVVGKSVDWLAKGTF